jgi:tape measure domain-containing protein
VAQGTRIARGYIAVDVDEDGARAALRGFVGFAGSAFKAAAASAAVLIGAAAKVGIEFNAMKEQATIAFSTLLGSGDKAAAMLKDLQKFAASTPFELPGLIDNARQLLGVGVAADKVIPTLSALGNAAGALGINQERFNNILLATTQAMGKGKLQGEELMQMVENGIPVWQLLAKATGKTVPELQKLSEQGKLIAQDVLPQLFAQMQKDYGGAMAAQSKTLIGVWSSLKDNTKILLGTAFEPLFDTTKDLVGAMGDLAASDDASAWAERVATNMRSAMEAAKIFARNVKAEFGDDVSAALSKVQGQWDDLWSIVKQGGSDAFGTLGEIAVKVAPKLVDLADSAGGLLKPALEAVAEVLAVVRDNADELGSGVAAAISAFGAVAGPALKILGEILKLVGEGLELVVSLVGDLSGPLGMMTGAVLAGVVAWRALSTVLGVVSSMWTRVAPAAVASSLAGMTRSVDNVALRAGVMTERLTGSADAGQRVASAGSRMGSALQKVGATLPLVGLAAVGLGLAFEANAQEAEQNARAQESLARSLLSGGKAAEDARAAQQKLRDFLALDIPDQTREQFQAQLDGVNDQLRKQTENLTAVQRAQQDATRAQNDYDLAVRNFGATSSQALFAQEVLRQKTGELEIAQTNAAQAARTHEQSLSDLANQALAAANADLQLKQSRLAIAQAEKGYAEAVREHGAASLEAQQSETQLEASYIRSAEAARQKAAADTAGLSPAKQQEAANKAYATELLNMAAAAGEKAPPALQKLVSGLTATQLAAAGVTVSINNAGQAVFRLPDGKLVTVAANIDPLVLAIAEAKRNMDKIQSKTVDVLVRLRTSGSSMGGFQIPGFATGGPIRPGQVFEAGEQGRELIVATQPGHVFTSAQTRAIERGNGQGVTIEHFELRALSDTFSLDQVAHELKLAGIH